MEALLEPSWNIMVWHAFVLGFFININMNLSSNWQPNTLESYCEFSIPIPNFWRSYIRHSAVFLTDSPQRILVCCTIDKPETNKAHHLSLDIYIYIYIYCRQPTDCSVVSQFPSEAIPATCSGWYRNSADVMSVGHLTREASSFLA